MKLKAITLFLKSLAWLPLPVLYAISSFAALLLHRVVRYRVGVVRDNLSKCFPDQSAHERRRIERDFYRRFTDDVVETIKLLHISDAEMCRRVEFENVEIIDSLLSQGRSIVVYFSHTFNWEWAPSVTLHTALKPSADVVFAQVYRPLRDAAADAIMLRIRSRFGSESIPKANTLRRLIGLRRSGARSITGFMSDQHPSHGDPGHLTTLLGRPTLMISGTETLARKLDMAVIYWDMTRTSRGHYRLTTRLICTDPTSMPEGSITETYTRLLEDAIRRDPAGWLWTHKRWKHPVNTNA